jgi:hypothetical protein
MCEFRRSEIALFGQSTCSKGIYAHAKTIVTVRAGCINVTRNFCHISSKRGFKASPRGRRRDHRRRLFRQLAGVYAVHQRCDRRDDLGGSLARESWVIVVNQLS